MNEIIIKKRPDSEEPIEYIYVDTGDAFISLGIYKTNYGRNRKLAMFPGWQSMPKVNKFISDSDREPTKEELKEIFDRLKNEHEAKRMIMMKILMDGDKKPKRYNP